MFGLTKSPNTQIAKTQTQISNPSSQGNEDLCIVSKGNGLIQFHPKQIKINGEVHKIDAYSLMRMIKNVTQTIGEYKKSDNAYSSYVVSSLRKARNDMVSDLDEHFHIKWHLQEGTSVFVV